MAVGLAVAPGSRVPVLGGGLAGAAVAMAGELVEDLDSVQDVLDSADLLATERADLGCGQSQLPVGRDRPIQLAKRLGVAYASIGEARDAVTAVLGGRRLMIVLDDVWSRGPLDAFTGLGDSVMVFTSRNQNLALMVGAAPRQGR